MAKQQAGTRGIPATSARAPAAPARVDREGTYLTDGAFLYRVVRRVATDAGDLVELEDCYALGVVEVPAARLRERGLRIVVPAEG